MAALAGDGTTGVLTGITMMSLTTTTPTSRTAEFSSTATTSIVPVDLEEEVDSAGEVNFTATLREAEVSPHSSMGRHHVFSLATTPARSADLIMEGRQEASPLAGNQAWVEAVSMEAAAFTEAAVVTAAEVIGNPVGPLNTILQTDLMRRRMKSCALQI